MNLHLLHMLNSLGLPSDSQVEFHRTRAGRHQMAAGSWSWYCTRNGVEFVGSQYTVKALLKAHKQGRVRIYRHDNLGLPELIVEV